MAAAVQGKQDGIDAGRQLEVGAQFRFVEALLQGQEGSLVGHKQGKAVGLAKAGEWNKLRLTVIGKTAEAAVNGVDQRLMVRLGDDLRRGDMTTELLRPVTLVWMVMSREIGRSIARTVVAALR